MQSLQLHRHLTQQFAEIGLKATPNARKNLAFLCQTLAFSPNCYLATLALGLPIPGRRENLIQHLRRTLKNQQLRSAACYQPLVRYLFAHWPDDEVNLVMDRTDLKRDLSLLTLGVAHQKRLVPLAWDLFPFGGTSAEEQTALMQRVQPDLPPTTQVRINFYGDCEFRAVPVRQLCHGFGWHWQVGLKSDLTREHQFGPVNVIADWVPAQETARYWALDLPADEHAWRRGRKRY